MKLKYRVTGTLVFLLIAALFCGAAGAEVIDSGTCGTNLTYTLTYAGILTITGTGPMTDYVDDDAPWSNHYDLIKTVNIEPGVTSIGVYAFDWCMNLTSITIPDSVTSIGEYAFCYCSSLTSITIPDNITSIGEYAFYDCSSLKSITIPHSITSIGDDAFLRCSSLTSITVADENAYYKDIDGVLFNKAGTSIICYPAAKTNASYKIPAGVTGIGKKAFSHCSSLTSITIPASVTGIGEYAFYGCYNLTSITIPADSKLTSIGEFAFSECNSLKSITIPAGVTGIGEGAFEHCNSLTSITIPAGVTSIDDTVFAGCNSLKSITIPASVTGIGEYAFSDCRSLTSITIPAGVTGIDMGAFAGCSGLSIIVFNGLNPPKMGKYCLDECSDKGTVFVPAGKTSAYKTALSKKGITLDASHWVIYEKASEITITGPAAVGTGKSIQLKAAATPAAAYQKFTWTSSDKTVAAVSSTGKVTGVKEGKVTITAKAKDGSGVYKKYTVYVKPATTAITITSSLSNTVGVGKYVTLKAVAEPSTAYQKFTWSSSKTSVATVSSTGKVTGKAAGTATITATAKDGSGVYKKYTVYVKPATTSIKITGSAGVAKGRYIQLTAAASPSTAYQKFTWKSSKTSVATVTSTGKVTGKAAGTTTITATAKDGSGINKTFSVTVYAKPVSKITLNAASKSIAKGKTYTLKAAISPTTSRYGGISWTSSNKAVATVDAKGVVTAKAKGTATITAKAKDGSGVKAVCKITVK